MIFTVEREVTITILDCCTCGGPVALSKDQERSLRESHRPFYCPAGHSQAFEAETEAERLRRVLHLSEIEKTRIAAELAQARTEADAALGEMVAAQQDAARAKRRAAAALCPCCNRSFTQLRRHLQTKHPEYKA